VRSNAGVVWLGINLLLSGAAAAAEPEVPPAPDLALLDYLGGLLVEDGRYVGPEDMRSVRAADVADDNEAATAELVR
jgi:hypothetical protein